MPVEKTVLPNGVRVVSEHLPHVGSASVGLWCRTGSADEEPSEAGITHLIEHMLFKGTESRTPHQIADAIESVGGSLNAFTDKQVTCYYAHTLAEEAETAVDVLTDMALNSRLDPDDLETEKRVVLEEIRQGEDEPSSLVFDLHLEAIWPESVYGLPVIGTSESVSSFQRDDLTRYMERRYRGGRILLAAAGRVEHAALVDWASERLAAIPEGSDDELHPRPDAAAGTAYHGRRVEQVHFCIGGEGPGLLDPGYEAAILCHEMLGGGMASRLFQEVREKRGLAYSVGTHLAAYLSGGCFLIYGGTGKATWDEMQEVIHAELARFRSEGPSDEELERAKRSICGSLVLALEGTGSRMRRMAKSELNRGRDVPVEETVQRVQGVTRAELMELSAWMLDSAKMRTTAIGPEDS
ncbi:MAG: insulinase family protein [Fimbriimonadaceae bacterium]|nr:insulinase family protein [Fimbriimonadaceae bacterium]